jgi:hypothetical protein
MVARRMEHTKKSSFQEKTEQCASRGRDKQALKKREETKNHPQKRKTRKGGPPKFVAKYRPRGRVSRVGTKLVQKRAAQCTSVLQLEISAGGSLIARGPGVRWGPLQLLCVPLLASMPGERGSDNLAVSTLDRPASPLLGRVSHVSSVC